MTRIVTGWGSAGSASDGVAEVGHAQVGDGVPAGDLLHGLQFLVGGGQGGFQAGDFPELAFALGFGDAGGEVVADLLQARHLGRVRAQEWAPYTAVLVRTRTAEVAGAHAKGDLA
jgi:hypothetical protein